jgi:hypothetical protein
MFNFGGMLSGIGDVGYMKVKKGIQAKHDKQMIETRAALQRKATLEAREYSRTEKTRADIKARRERAETLKLMGVTNNATIAYLSGSDSTFEMVKDLRKTLDARDAHTGEHSDIMDYITTTQTSTRGDPLAEGEKFTTDYSGKDFNLQGFLKGDLNPDLDFQVSFAKKYLGKAKTAEERLAIKRSQWQQAEEKVVQLEKDGIGGSVLKQAKENLNSSYGKWHVLNQSMKTVQAKENLINMVQEKVIPKDTLEMVGTLQSTIKTRFDVLKAKTKKDDPVYSLLQSIVLRNFGDEGGFALEAAEGANVKQKDLDIAYNIIARPVLEAHYNTYGDDRQLQLEAIKGYFDSFITTTPEDMFYGKAFVDGSKEIPTTAFYNHLKKRGVGKRTLVQSADNFLRFQPSQERLNELIFNYEQNFM